MALSLEGHTTRAFDGDLSSLHIQAVAMGALVIEQVQLAVNAYSGWDRSIATVVLDRERRVNLYDSEIEEAALQVIARRQPVAQDLRMKTAYTTAGQKTESVTFKKGQRERFEFGDVIVTHSMQQAARVSQRTAYFHLGDLIEVGETDRIFTNPRHKLTEDYITGRFG